MREECCNCSAIVYGVGFCVVNTDKCLKSLAEHTAISVTVDCVCLSLHFSGLLHHPLSGELDVV